MESTYRNVNRNLSRAARRHRDADDKARHALSVASSLSPHHLPFNMDQIVDDGGGAPATITLLACAVVMIGAIILLSV